jgi:hypothetical protein
MTDHPPQWADALLQLVLSSDDRECVSGDLLETYRDDILPARGRAAADRWYVGHVCGYVWRATGLWSLIFAGSFVARAAYDWRVPTTDFAARSAITTAIGVTTLLCAAFWTSWRARSVAAGITIAAITSQLAAVISAVGVTALIAVWHDARTLEAIAGSGGLFEAFSLPFMMIVPALVLGTIGGMLGAITRGVR